MAGDAKRAHSNREESNAMSGNVNSSNSQKAKVLAVVIVVGVVFAPDGKICSSHSNLPSYAIEGGLGGFICLDPGT